jgi:hypothetical protein
MTINQTANTVLSNEELSQIAGGVDLADIIDYGPEALASGGGTEVGAETGAEAGSFLGPVGTVVGAGIGAGLGWLISKL